MGDVWMGSYKLFIVIVRFVDGEKVTEDKKDQKKIYVEKKIADDKPMPGRKVGAESYCDILTNKKKSTDHMVIKIDGNVKGFAKWYEYALVGRVSDFKILISLRKLLKVNGYNRVEIKYLGGLRVGLVFEDVELLNYFKDTDVVWKGWFEQLEHWEGQSFDYERIAWLKIHGVPLHLCIDPVFNVIGSKFGKVIQDAQMDDDVGDLSVTCIGILCDKTARLHGNVDIAWNDRVFNVWVEEETGEWIPDCLTVIDEESLVSGSEDLQSGKESSNNMENDMHVEDMHGGKGREPGEWLEGEKEVSQDDNAVPSLDMNIGIDSSKDGENGMDDRNKNRRMVFKKKRGGKKGGLHVSVSPLGQERPRKRTRRDDDPFDIDRFIGIVSSGGTMEGIMKWR
ncbi:hypothetical protein HanRHA438_Chr08g0347751 [Helianthus annuus]|uniref:DUF4283 domain-containing protein n=1 Tax=Helianthus annuus TaxID=4232 RepID=A0A9K3IER2_HELAN|nr:hypothetical protein HanXRQr2_Chr08g0336341 [Helianthus annuus]KAJ0546631.1 hypothetical protein HanIR_Chr08g0363111 [Helianthus annuus]KAJ0553323.1 hypothetical protein HanHA89_Chr08g0295131 [Helianthus annuus]KAJ0722234.1 hypothetical protein HanOQP8_Chr08g0284371 [Helianthus annuus]KAJ0897626.1 hypothetical protein HanRHA438_Chr08g0347751 [Helianthus annuus]